VAASVESPGVSGGPPNVDPTAVATLLGEIEGGDAPTDDEDETSRRRSGRD
jgi:hypothetical protein